MDQVIVLRDICAGAWHVGSDRVFTTQLRAGERFSAVAAVDDEGEVTSFLDAETGLFIFAEQAAICHVRRSLGREHPFGEEFGTRN